MTFSVGLNVPLAASARAQLVDEATQAQLAVATRADGAYVFKDVPVVPPGSSSARVFRITNVCARMRRAFPGGAGLQDKSRPFVAVSAPLRIPLAGAQLNVAVAA